MAETERPVEIDYTTTVPEQVLGHCCYHRLCVWIQRPTAIEVFSVKLLFREYLSVDHFRDFINIPRDKKRREGERFSSDVYRATVHYAMVRSHSVGHAEAMEDTYLLLPEPLRNNQGALKYFEATVKRLVERAEELVKHNIHRAPETGWKVLTDETQLKEPLLFPISYLPRVLHYALTVPRAYTGLVFCNDNSCYPAPDGIWPDDRWLVAVDQSIRHDVYYYFIEKFGATSILDYLTNLDIDEFAISVKPGRRWSKVVLYIPVSNPAEHVVRVAKMQELVEKVSRQVEELMLHDLEKPRVEGLKALGITDEDIARSVGKLIKKGESV